MEITNYNVYNLEMLLKRVNIQWQVMLQQKIVKLLTGFVH